MFYRYYFVRVESVGMKDKYYSYRVHGYRSFFSQPTKAFSDVMNYYDKKYGIDNYIIEDFKRV